MRVATFNKGLKEHEFMVRIEPCTWGSEAKDVRLVDVGFIRDCIRIEVETQPGKTAYFAQKSHGSHDWVNIYPDPAESYGFVFSERSPVCIVRNFIPEHIEP